MTSIDEHTFKSAYIICVGSERLRIANDADFREANAIDIARYHQNGVPAEVTSAREFHPQLNAFWSSIVLKVLDASMASPFAYTLFVLDPKTAHRLVENHNDDNRLNEESWTMLERAREGSFHNIWDVKTTSLLYLETNDDPQSSSDGESILVRILKYMNCWNGIASIAQNYSNLLVCRVSIGKEWDQMTTINVLKPLNSRLLSIPDTVFDVLSLMKACKDVIAESDSLTKHKFVKTHAKEYFELARKGRHDPIKLYDNKILTDIESWQLRQSAAHDLISDMNLDQRLRFISSKVEKNGIVDYSPGLKEPMNCFNIGVLTRLHTTLEDGRNTITRIRNTTEEKRAMIMALFTEFVSLRMHSEATHLSKTAIWISVIALLVGVVSFVAQNVVN